MPTTLTQLPPTSWETRAACRHNPDLWASGFTHQRAFAIHICVTHCPVYRQCEAGVAVRPCPGTVQAGVLYNDAIRPAPAKRQPSASGRHCAACAEVKALPAKPAPQSKPTSRWPDCGTARAYKRHIKRREKACAPCREAERVASKQRRADRKAANGVADTAAPSPVDTGRRGGLGNRPPDPVYQQRVTVVAQLAGQQWPDRHIAEHLQLTQWQVRHLRRTNNIAAGMPHGRPPSPPHRTPEMAEKRRARVQVIAELAAAGASDREIGLVVGWRPQNVWRARRANNIAAGVGRSDTRASRPANRPTERATERAAA
jgi:hypothetical protein